MDSNEVNNNLENGLNNNSTGDFNSNIENMNNNSINDNLEVFNTDIKQNDFNSTQSENVGNKPNEEVSTIFDDTTSFESVNESIGNQNIQPNDQINNNSQMSSASYEQNSDFNAINDVVKSSNEKKKKSKLLIVIIFFVIALLGIGVWYYFHINSTKTIITSITNNAFDKFTGNIEEIKKIGITENSILVSSDISLKTNMKELNDLNSLKLNYTYGMDYKNKEIETGLQISEDSKKLIEVLGYVLNDNVYVLLKDDYPNIINIGETNISQLFNTSNISIEEIKDIITDYKNIFLKALNMDDFVKTNDTITLNGSQVNVKKLTYVFDSDKYNKLMKNIMDISSKDKELINKLAKLSGTDASNIENSLKSSVNDSYDTYIDPITFNIYIKGMTPELVGIDVVNQTSNNIQMRIDNDVTTIIMNVLNEEVKITLKDDNGVIKADLNSKINGKDLNIKMDITSNKTDDKNYNGLVKIAGTYDNKNIELDINYKVTIGAKISDVDISNAKAMNTITEQELNYIQQNIILRFQNSKIYKMISSLMGNTQNY